MEIDNTPSYEIIGVKGVILRGEGIEKEGISQFRTFKKSDAIYQNLVSNTKFESGILIPLLD